MRYTQRASYAFPPTQIIMTLTGRYKPASLPKGEIIITKVLKSDFSHYNLLSLCSLFIFVLVNGSQETIKFCFPQCCIYIFFNCAYKHELGVSLNKMRYPNIIFQEREKKELSAYLNLTKPVLFLPNKNETLKCLSKYNLKVTTFQKT